MVKKIDKLDLIKIKNFFEREQKANYTLLIEQKGKLQTEGIYL